MPNRCSFSPPSARRPWRKPLFLPPPAKRGELSRSDGGGRPPGATRRKPIVQERHHQAGLIVSEHMRSHIQAPLPASPSDLPDPRLPIRLRQPGIWPGTTPTRSSCTKAARHRRDQNKSQQTRSSRPDQNLPKLTTLDHPDRTISSVSLEFVCFSRSRKNLT